MWEATYAARVTARAVSRSSLIDKRGSITSESLRSVRTIVGLAGKIGVLTSEI